MDLETDRLGVEVELLVLDKMITHLTLVLRVVVVPVIRTGPVARPTAVRATFQICPPLPFPKATNIMIAEVAVVAATAAEVAWETETEAEAAEGTTVGIPRSTTGRAVTGREEVVVRAQARDLVLIRPNRLLVRAALARRTAGVPSRKNSMIVKKTGTKMKKV
jgi:hypothetical protein